MLTTAKSANVGFSQVVPHSQTQLTLLTQKIPFINSEKKFFGCKLCAQKY